MLNVVAAVVPGITMLILFSFGVLWYVRAGNISRAEKRRKVYLGVVVYILIGILLTAIVTIVGIIAND